MSKNPIHWIKQITNFVDRVYIHLNIEDDIYDAIELVKKSNCQVGIVIQSLEEIKF